jgi:molybdopterin-biosynthesis enzyme MoeA-like protein
LAYHQETLDRMRKALRSFSNVPPNASTIRNRERMALLPTGNEVKVHYADNADIWTPVVIIREQVHILPGVPTLFKCLLDSLPIPQRLIDMHHQTAMHPFCRILIGTHLNESSIADILCAEQAQVQGSIKIGSYPCWKKDPTGGPVSVVVSVVGRDRLAVDACAKRLLPLLQGQLLEDH